MIERMNTATKNLAECYTALPLLALNDIATNSGKMAVTQQEQVMKVNS